jgi:glutamate-5-semialdehyde dehydrogenase
VDILLGLDDNIDLVIPRGSTSLVRAVQSRTRIPVLGHAEGICHVYVHASADVTMAADIVTDSKVQYPAACNAVETVLVDAAIAPTFLPVMLDRMAQHHVEMRGCDRTRALADSLRLSQPLAAATEEDWATEYGALILSCKLVDGLQQAIAHIARYGSKHTDAIVASDPAAAAQFLATVDAAGVFHNASTRFADGARYGFGAEVGVSTSKLHARGPVGLEGLTTYKYLLRGQGQLVATYSGPAGRPFVHHALPLDADRQA